MKKYEIKKGSKFNRWTFIKKSQKKYYGVFLCECGTERDARLAEVKAGYSKSCGCLALENTMIRMIKKGDKFNQWTFIKKSNRVSYGEFLCDCGKKREAFVYNIIGGTSRGCGCSSRLKKWSPIYMGNYIKIPLTQGFFAIIDNNEDDLNKIKNMTWCVLRREHTDYATSHVLKNGKFIGVRMHRLLLGISDPKILVDHRNHMGLDNRSRNLRVCNSVQNGQNRKTNKNTKFKGVCASTGSIKNPYRAYITINKKQTHLGLFKTEKEAALAYDKVALEQFGGFAKLNFMEKKNEQHKK